MAPNPRSNIHNDTWMTDAYRGAGPLGHSPRGVLERDVAGAVRIADVPLARIHRQRLPVAGRAAAGAGDRPAARSSVLATYDMPNAPDPPGTKAYQNFAGGGYFFLDGARPHLERHEDEPPVRAAGLARRPHASRRSRDYDLTSVLEPDERISSALPDFRGRIWFVSKKNGKVGILNPRTRRIRADPARRGHPELVHRRPRAASTSSPATACTASARAAASRGSTWKVTLRATRASSSPARPTPARARRRRS